MCYSLPLHRHHLYQLCSSLLLHYFWIDRKNTTCNIFMLNMVKGHHLQLRCLLLLFSDLKQLNSKATVAHFVVIQNKVNELLGKGAPEQSIGVTGFFFLNI